MLYFVWNHLWTRLKSQLSQQKHIKWVDAWKKEPPCCICRASLAWCASMADARANPSVSEPTSTSAWITSTSLASARPARLALKAEDWPRGEMDRRTTSTTASTAEWCAQSSPRPPAPAPPRLAPPPARTRPRCRSRRLRPRSGSSRPGMTRPCRGSRGPRRTRSA